MTLLFIYGPPATGKLTVAKEIVKLTGYKLFHNQLTVDLLSSLFKFGSPVHTRLNAQIRLKLFEEAAKQSIDGIIFTFCYAKDSDDWFVKKVIEKVEGHSGKVYFVQLYCDKKELFNRVKHASRENFDKIKSPNKLGELLKSIDLFSKVPFKKSLSIDNTKIAPEKVARVIVKHYKL